MATFKEIKDWCLSLLCIYPEEAKTDSAKEVPRPNPTQRDPVPPQDPNT